jgi:outer membrane receptor protein involved in Fe transport
MIVPTALLAVSALVVPQQDTTVQDTIIQLDEFVVSGTRSAEVRRIDQPLALSTTSPALTDRASGALAAHLLRDLPGVQIQQTSAGQASVILRGMLGNQVLMLVNGIPMNNGTYRDGPGQYLATIDPETVERIEVIRGPASVLYGSDAQGGVVNLITKPHPHLGAGSIRLSGSASSAESMYRGRLSAGYRARTWDVAFGGTFLAAGDLRAGGSIGRQEPTGFDASGFDAELNVRPADRHTLSGVVQHFHMRDVPRYDRYVTFRAPVLGKDYEHLFNPQTRQLAYARYTFEPGVPALTRIETTLSLAVQREGRYRIKLADDGGPDDSETHWRDDAYTPGLTIVGSSAAFLGEQVLMLSWGGDWHFDMMQSEGYVRDLDTGTRTPITVETEDGPQPFGNFPDGATADRLGVFLSADAPISSLIRVSAGGRLSRFHNSANLGTALGGEVQNSSSALTGQLGIVLSPAESWRFAARVAQGFRAPNLYDLTRVGPVPSGIALPNPDASPERSLSSELAVRFNNANVAVDLTAYYTRVTDFIDRVPGEFLGDTLFNGERVFLGQNVGTAHIRGFEAEAAKRFGPVQVNATLLYTHGDQTTADGVETPMSKIPPVGGHAAVRWTTPIRTLWIEYLLRWAARQDRLGDRDLDDPRIPSGGTPGYAVHGIRAAVAVTSTFNISAGFENLGDALYRTHASGVDAAGRHLWVGAAVVGGL